MNYQQLIKMLDSDHFTKIVNHCDWFQEKAVLYVKEINDGIFLIFVMEREKSIKNIRVVIAQFQGMENIGINEPVETLFYLSIKHLEDLRYFDRYLGFSYN